MPFVWTNLTGQFKGPWICESCEQDQEALQQDVSVTIQPASFLYEPTAELQLVEYRIVHVPGNSNTKLFLGGCGANGTPTITVFGGNQLPVQLPYNKTCKYHEESQIRKVTKKGWEMHNKLAGTKEFGRTIRFHNTSPPP